MAEYIYFSRAYGTFSRLDHILDNKSSLGKFKKIEIVSSIFSDHNAIRLGINHRGKTVKKKKTLNTWRLNNMHLNSQNDTEEIKGEVKKDT